MGAEFEPIHASKSASNASFIQVPVHDFRRESWVAQCAQGDLQWQGGMRGRHPTYAAVRVVQQPDDAIN
ncbi:hypothetical protein GCM10009839_10180 [Catenulispora yoronensis]|uniref:Uncharacterized protein n=1 Tax=Catenulispora yoronensis TaxID=450799 RepID=A0ABP5F8N1_9ACTN